MRKALLVFCLIFCYYLSAEDTMSFRIQPFEPKYQPEVTELIERIQVGEFHIPIEEGQRKELQSISSAFQKDKGNYWVALLDEKVIGTIAVVDIGHEAFELRDVFLDKQYRSQSAAFAKKLLDTVFEWSKEHGVKTIYLGTTLAFRAAHRFYEKHGFREITRKEMPPYTQPMDCDEKFYRFDL
jgi:N-acetylglutamate synthase-like GNAT family acetyltransferase